MFDWIRLLQDNGIPFITAGNNVSKGNIGFKCPFCGEEDPSFHGGVNLTTGAWSCWRNTTHKGKSPYRLISALLGVTNGQAQHIAQAYSGGNADEFDALAGFINAPEGKQMAVTMPPEFDDIKRNSLTHKFWLYLQNRGFDDPDKLIEDYNLKCCLTGRWKGRLIIPVYTERKVMPNEPKLRERLEQTPFYDTRPPSVTGADRLIGWQGRSIRTVEGVPRYLTSSPAVKKTIFNLQNLKNGGECLYICEGPMDSLKIDYYGKPRIRATCTFGVEFKLEQVEILYKLSSKFSRLVLLFDNDPAGTSEGFRLSDWLPVAGFGSLPDGHKDTDKLESEQMKEWLNGMA